MQSVRALPGKRHGRMPGGNRHPTRHPSLRLQAEKASFRRGFRPPQAAPGTVAPAPAFLPTGFSRPVCFLPGNTTLTKDHG